MLANDRWFKGVSVQYGPDGSIYFIDWSDTGECHDVDVTDRQHGRIYRVTYQGTKPAKVDLAAETSDRLVEMQTWSNEWYVRHARVVLRDRGLTADARAKLRRLLDGKDSLHRLRAMWTLRMCDELDEGLLLKCLGDSDEYVRAWAIQLLGEDGRLEQETLARFAAMAKEDPSAVVRLYLASAMQRVPVGQRRAVVEALVKHGEDGNDPNLPLMDWYALEPWVGSDAKGAAALLPKVKLAKVRELMARRMAAK
jgi:hypothetical protein